jgi:hypothetical protein
MWLFKSSAPLLQAFANFVCHDFSSAPRDCLTKVSVGLGWSGVTVPDALLTEEMDDEDEDAAETAEE